MREIKFRVWDGSRMGRVLLAAFVGDTPCAYDVDFGDPFTRCLPEVCGLMQFTGLHDQNGREIYEGDILKWEHSDRTLEVRWEGAGWVLFSKIFGKFGMPDGDTCSPINTSGYTRNSVVVGNIHENPELLK